MNWVTKTKFDHSRNVVEFRALVPAIERIPDPQNGSRLPVAYVDFASGLDFLGSIIQKVIDTVSGYLEGCKNTRIRTVRIVSQYSAPDTFRTAESFLPDHWALPLAAALNAAEVAGMTALVLRSFCKFGFGKPTVSFRDQVSQVCEAVAHVHPCNALTRKLIRQVQTSFRWDSEPDKAKRDEFQEFLTKYLADRADAGNRVSEEAMRQNVLCDSSGKELDYVVVYGYSRSVLSTLITGGFRGIVLLIDIDESVRGPWVNREETRIQDIMMSQNIKIRKIGLAALNGVLRQIRGKLETLAFFIGSRCILQRKRVKDVYLCPVGTWQVATAVNANGGRTIAFAEADKFVSDAAEVLDIERVLQRLAEEQDCRPWAQVDQLTLGTDIKLAVKA